MIIYIKLYLIKCFSNLCHQMVEAIRCTYVAMLPPSCTCKHMFGYTININYDSAITCNIILGKSSSKVNRLASMNLYYCSVFSVSVRLRKQKVETFIICVKLWSILRRRIVISLLIIVFMWFNFRLFEGLWKVTPELTFLKALTIVANKGPCNQLVDKGQHGKCVWKIEESSNLPS